MRTLIAVAGGVLALTVSLGLSFFANSTLAQEVHARFPVIASEPWANFRSVQVSMFVLFGSTFELESEFALRDRGQPSETY